MISSHTRPPHVVQNNQRAFSKPPLDPKELLAKLRARGMVVDAGTALPYLTQVGGYRMKGYWYQWIDPQSRRFQQGTSFDKVIERYEFDRELRRITGDALERIELMVRASISNTMSKHEGPHWFMKDSLFKTSPSSVERSAKVKQRPRKRTLYELVIEEVSRMRHKPFIAHYLKQYNEPAFPPSWAISECLSFGAWSTVYPTLSNVEYRKEISRQFKVEDTEVFASWLHAFSVMRNTVFHHGRLLGAQTSVTPRDYHKRHLQFKGTQARAFFATATVINYVCNSIRRGPRWKSDLEALFSRYPTIPYDSALGFPEGWPNVLGWRTL